MSNETTGAVFVIAGALALIMAVRGSWKNVWHALVPSSASGQPSQADFASFSIGPGGVEGGSGVGSAGSGRPGSAPAPFRRVPQTSGSMLA